MTDQPGRFYQGPNEPSGSQPGDPGTRFALKPMTLADILDYTFKLFRLEWKSITTLVTVLSLPLVLVSIVWQIFSTVGANSLENDVSETMSALDVFGGVGGLVSFLLYVGVAVVVGLVFTPLVIGAITRIVAGAYLGTRVAPKAAVRSMVPLWLTLIGSSILSGLIIFAGFVACIIPAIPLGVLLAVIYPVIAVEETSASGALSRSFALMKRNFWNYLGTLALAFVVSAAFYFGISIVQTLVALLFFGVGGALGIDVVGQVLGIIVSSVFDLFLQVAMTAFLAIIATLLYFDARVRFEGFDLQMMASRMSIAQVPQQQSPGLSQQDPTQAPLQDEPPTSPDDNGPIR